MWWVLVLACTGLQHELPEVKDQPLPNVPSEVPSEEPVAPKPLLSPDGPVTVGVAFEGVSPLYRGYFGTDRFVEEVSRRLGPCLARASEVVVSFDSKTLEGKIVLRTLPAGLACVPSKLDDGLDAAAMVPILQALVGYRDAVGGAFDLRVYSFKVGVRLMRKYQVCELYAGGQYPPDGSTFSPCVSIQGHQRCLSDDRKTGTTRLVTSDKALAKDLRACL